MLEGVKSVKLGEVGAQSGNVKLWDYLQKDLIFYFFLLNYEKLLNINF